jgi:hypothetical protein
VAQGHPSTAELVAELETTRFAAATSAGGPRAATRRSAPTSP